MENGGEIPKGLLVESQKKLVDFSVKSVASEGHLNRNEDSYIARGNFFGVFDGVGGSSPDGDKASSLARDIITQDFENLPQNITPQEAQDKIYNTIIRADQQVKQKGRENGSGMGTTASIGLICEDSIDKRKAVIGNIGDSRVYLFRDGNLEQITLDDNSISLKNSINKAKEIQSKISNVINPNSELNEEELSFFKHRNEITQAVGHGPIVPRIFVIDLLPNDKLFVCSDGISDNLMDTQIKNLLNNFPDSATAVQRIIEASKLISKSISSRSKDDDMTALIIDNKIKLSTKIETTLPSANLRIQRSNGQFESGWIFSSFNNETRLVTVTKKDGDQVLQKEISMENLERFNRPAKPEDVTKAQNIGQLMDTINQLGEINGSKKNYSASEISSLITQVLNGNKTIDYITNTYGIRDMVSKLKKH